MKCLIRKVTFKLYPNASQTEKLEALFVHHHQLYNWALADRIQTYQHFHYSLNYIDQAAINTHWRKTRKQHGLFNANAQSEQVTLKRVDRAFQQFFRKLRDGHVKAGFPRFKSYERFSGFGYASHGDGWKLFLNPKKHGAVRLSNVGMVKMRGKARNEHGTPKTAEVLKKSDGWYLSVSFEYDRIQRSSGTQGVGLDWGVLDYMSLVNTGGEYQQIDNPRYLKQSLESLKALQQVFVKTKKHSSQWHHLKKQIARLHRKVANQRKNFTHQVTADIIKHSGLIAIEEIQVKGMTKSRKGTVDKPGKLVKAKSGLNREILNTAPAMTYNLLKSKAEEAGIEFIETPTKQLKPSQRCPSCDEVIKKDLSQRMHQCDCGCTLPRDVASALVNLNCAVNAISDVRNLRPGEIILKETPSKLAA